MNPMDSVQPAKSQKKVARKTAQTTRPVSMPAQSPTAWADPKRRKLVMLVTTVMAVIVIGWLILLKTNAIFTDGESGSGWLRVRTSFERLVNTVKTNVLKISPPQDSSKSDEERIQNLEQQVFPEFTNQE